MTLRAWPLNTARLILFMVTPNGLPLTLIQLPRQNLPLPLEFAQNAFFRPRHDKGDRYFPGGEKAAIGGKQSVLNSSEGIEV